MKVECISNEDSDLTIGKSYEIIKKGINGYWVIDDMDIKTWYHTYLFKPVCKCNKNKKIKCVNKENNSYLTVGKTYDVIETDGQCCKITNDNGIDQYYSKEYFKAISESKNEKVECIDNKYIKKYLTIGKIYNVVDDYDDHYHLVNDNGDSGWFNKERFKHTVQKNKKVECVNNIFNNFTIGKTYDIIKTDGNIWEITNDDGIVLPYIEGYFKDITKSKNMKVECISNGNLYDLTIGKTYEVISELSDFYNIIDDKGRNYWYLKKWFKQIPESKNEKVEYIKNNAPLYEDKYFYIAFDEHSKVCCYFKESFKTTSEGKNEKKILVKLKDSNLVTKPNLKFYNWDDVYDFFHSDKISNLFDTRNFKKLSKEIKRKFSINVSIERISPVGNYITLMGGVFSEYVEKIIIPAKQEIDTQSEVSKFDKEVNPLGEVVETTKEEPKDTSESKNIQVEYIGNNENSYNLTIGKTYEVICENDNWYWIINDKGIISWYHKDLFKHDIQKMDTQEGVSKLNETPLTEEHKITWKYHLKDFVEHLRCVEMRNYIHENNRKNSELLNAICDKFKGGEVGIHFLLSGHRNFDEIVKEAYHNYLYSIFCSPIKRSFKFMKWSDLDDILQEDDELEVKIFRIILKEKHEYGSIYYDFDKTLSEKVTDLVNTTEKKSCVSPNEDKVASMFSELTGKEISSDEVVMLLSLAKMVKELINK